MSIGISESGERVGERAGNLPTMEELAGIPAFWQSQASPRRPGSPHRYLEVHRYLGAREIHEPASPHRFPAQTPTTGLAW